MVILFPLTEPENIVPDKSRLKSEIFPSSYMPDIVYDISLTARKSRCGTHVCADVPVSINFLPSI